MKFLKFYHRLFPKNNNYHYDVYSHTFQNYQLFSLLHCFYTCFITILLSFYSQFLISTAFLRFGVDQGEVLIRERCFFGGPRSLLEEICQIRVDTRKTNQKDCFEVIWTYWKVTSSVIAMAILHFFSVVYDKMRSY